MFVYKWEISVKLQINSVSWRTNHVCLLTFFANLFKLILVNRVAKQPIIKRGQIKKVLKKYLHRIFLFNECWPYIRAQRIWISTINTWAPVLRKNYELSAHSSDGNLYLETVCLHNTTEGSSIETVFSEVLFVFL